MCAIFSPPTVFWGHGLAWPNRLGVNAHAVVRAAFDDAVGPILNAEEVKRLVRIVAPTPGSRRTETQHRAFRYVDAVTVHQKLPAAANDNINLIVP
jgi:hypothetical protein